MLNFDQLNEDFFFSFFQLTSHNFYLSYTWFIPCSRDENPFQFHPGTKCFIPSNAIFHQFRESKKPEVRISARNLCSFASTIDRPLKRIFLVSRYFFHFIKTIPKAKGSGVGNQERDKRGNI